MSALLGLGVFLTIFSCLGFGILCGYMAVSLILRAMSFRPRQAEPAMAPISQAATASGD